MVELEKDEKKRNEYIEIIQMKPNVSMNSF